MTFYATIDADSIRSYMPTVPYLLPASSWARYHLRPVRLPCRLRHLAADCGGFVATRIWGDYRFSPKQYVTWLHTFKPEWAATMDYCCEDEITAGKPGLVRQRQARTTQMAWYFWQQHRSVPWVWVPTIQGWLPADYQQHARAMKPLIHTMRAFYVRTNTFRVGIGTFCRRASAAMIHEVVQAVQQELPGIPLHLWGVKLGALQSPAGLPAAVVSVDSASWNSRFGRQLEEYKRSGLSQRKFAFTVALPRYLAKVKRALRRSARRAGCAPSATRPAAASEDARQGGRW